jgi:predicted GIY-YIG superfamily endonuclease
MEYYVYILECADGSFYTGMTSDVALRLDAHNEGAIRTAYTYGRRPVRLVWAEGFASRIEALDAEHQIKGWSRKKKAALIENDWETIHQIVKAERKVREQRKTGPRKDQMMDRGSW